MPTKNVVNAATHLSQEIAAEDVLDDMAVVICCIESVVGAGKEALVKMSLQQARLAATGLISAPVSKELRRERCSTYTACVRILSTRLREQIGVEEETYLAQGQAGKLLVCLRKRVSVAVWVLWLRADGLLYRWGAQPDVEPPLRRLVNLSTAPA